MKRVSARGRKSVGATAHGLLIMSIGTLDINWPLNDQNNKVHLKL